MYTAYMLNFLFQAITSHVASIFKYLKFIDLKFELRN